MLTLTKEHRWNFQKNELGSICGKAQPIVSSPHYPHTDSSNCNLKNENRFAEPTEQIFEVAPHQLFDFLQKYGDGGTLRLKFGGAK